MNRNVFPVAIICLSLLISCKSEESDYEGPSFPTASPAPDTMVKNNTSPQVLPINPSLPNASAVLNPAHGQPGHRCDIAVGAPLNTAPRTTQPIVQQVSAQPVQIQNQNTVGTTTSVTKAGMNPVHGQPGHRCDLPVGAPLNSKPKNNQATPGTVQSVTSTAQYSTLDKTTTTTAPGMNPPHGQPGHRCDIAVGAPLNSKPVDKPAEQMKPLNKDTSSGN